MTNRPLTSLLCPAVIVGIAALLFAVQRKSKSNVLLSEIHNTIKENAEVTRALKRTLRSQSGAIHAIRNYLVPVSKGV
jgi:hypothetical protein